jgi:biotin synthase-related radical SAM superfamily protein
MERLLQAVRAVREQLPTIPIGVEPHLDSADDIGRLHAAGADELKVNIETPDQVLHRLVRPGIDLEETYRALERGVEVFGRGKVATNIIVGLGESDEIVLEAVGRLAAMGVVPTVRPLRMFEATEGSLTEALDGLDVDYGRPEAGRLLELSRRVGSILAEHGLGPGSFATMCHSCGCCDLLSRGRQEGP